MTLNRKISAGAALFAVVLALGATAAAALTLRRVEQTAASVRHTDTVLHQLDLVSRHAVDVETGMRGYVVTGRDDFLDPYRSGRTAVLGDVGELRRLTADPRQQARIGELEPLVRKRIALADGYVDLRRTQGLGPAAAAVATGEGLLVTRQIRGIIDVMEAEERTLLEQRISDDQAAARDLYVALAVACGVSILTLVALALLFGRSVGRRTRELLDGLSRVARGELDVTVPTADDELGRIADAFNRMVAERREAREELAHAHVLLDGLFRAAPIGVVAIDATGNVELWNPAAEDMLGWRRDEAVGKPVHELFDEATDALGAVRDRVIARRQVVSSTELVVRSRAGPVFPASVSAAPLEREGRVAGVVLLVEDISARTRAVEALRRSEAQFRGLIERLPDGVFVHRERKAIYANAALARMLDYASPTQLVDLPITWLCHPEDIPLLDPRLHEPDGGARPSEVRMVQRGCTICCGEATSIDVDFEERPATVVVVRDLSERKRVERAREDLLHRLQAVLDVAPVGIVLSVGDRWDGNKRACELLGRSITPSIDVGAYRDALLDSDERPLERAQLPGVRALAGERLQGFEMRIRQPDGHVVPVLVNSAPIPGNGSPSGAVITFEDITTFKDLERLRAEWSSIVAHDLRQPLSSISLCAQLVAERTAADPAVYRRIQQIKELAHRLNRMIQDLLDFSRIEARQLTIEREPLDVLEPVRDAINQIAPEASGRSLDLRVHGDGAIVDVDRDRLAQVMDNLLSNAIKYGDPGTPIVIDLDVRPEEIAIAVTNQGPGILPEHAQHLFERFQRLHDPARRGIKGIGLGLHIAKALVEAHGGHIGVESVPGKTTTFRFTLPREQSVRAVPQAG